MTTYWLVARSSTHHNDFRHFVRMVEADPNILTALDLDIVTITPPCFSETNMREYNERDEHPDGDLFVEYTPRFAHAWAKVKRKKPKIIMIEITPSRSMSSHRLVQANIEKAGFNAAVVDIGPN